MRITRRRWGKKLQIHVLSHFTNYQAKRGRGEGTNEKNFALSNAHIAFKLSNNTTNLTNPSIKAAGGKKSENPHFIMYQQAILQLKNAIRINQSIIGHRYGAGLAFGTYRGHAKNGNIDTEPQNANVLAYSSNILKFLLNDCHSVDGACKSYRYQRCDIFCDKTYRVNTRSRPPVWTLGPIALRFFAFRASGDKVYEIFRWIIDMQRCALKIFNDFFLVCWRRRIERMEKAYL